MTASIFDWRKGNLAESRPGWCALVHLDTEGWSVRWEVGIRGALEEWGEWSVCCEAICTGPEPGQQVHVSIHTKWRDHAAVGPGESPDVPPAGQLESALVMLAGALSSAGDVGKALANLASPEVSDVDS